MSSRRFQHTSADAMVGSTTGGVQSSATPRRTIWARRATEAMRCGKPVAKALGRSNASVRQGKIISSTWENLISADTR